MALSIARKLQIVRTKRSVFFSACEPQCEMDCPLRMSPIIASDTFRHDGCPKSLAPTASQGQSRSFGTHIGSVRIVHPTTFDHGRNRESFEMRNSLCCAEQEAGTLYTALNESSNGVQFCMIGVGSYCKFQPNMYLNDSHQTISQPVLISHVAILWARNKCGLAGPVNSR